MCTGSSPVGGKNINVYCNPLITTDMSTISEIIKTNKALKERVQSEIDSFGDIERKLSSPLLSDNPAEFKELSKAHAMLSDRVDVFKKYLNLLERLEEANLLLNDPGADNDIKEMAEEELETVKNELFSIRETVEFLLIPPDPNEGKSVIIEIRAGTGGEEAALFVGDLYKMYLHFSEKMGLKTEHIYAQETGLGGYKEVAFSVHGKRAYELFHLEGGGHRVQRIPVTESGGRIHTSAVTVAALPEAEEEELEIEDKDLKIDVFRASGAGGQHVNKTESAVRILHIPSGIVVSCQDERSQHKNRARAMRVLRARLQEKQDQERHAAESDVKKKQVGTGDRSDRIRTYNFPQGRVTDHRANFTSYNLESVIEGDMDDLVEAVLKHEKEEKLKILNI